MVGHTGDLHAAVAAMTVTDLALGRLLRGIESLGGVALVTADHGNCEEMYERNKKTGEYVMGEDGLYKSKTSHTTRPVPIAIFDPHRQIPVGLKAPSAGAGLGHLPATTRNSGLNRPRIICRAYWLTETADR